MKLLEQVRKDRNVGSELAEANVELNKLVDQLVSGQGQTQQKFNTNPPRQESDTEDDEDEDFGDEDDDDDFDDFDDDDDDDGFDDDEDDEDEDDEDDY